MISSSEKKAFFKSAIVNRKYKDAFLVAKAHSSDAFRKWRWKHGIVLRKNIESSKEISKSISEYLALGNWAGDTEGVINNCRNYFKIIQPNVYIGADTFRASGGKRLSWPNSIEEFKDSQDAHAWHRLYWVLDSDNDLAFKYLQVWFDKGPDEIMIHPYTVSERICNLCQFIAVSSISKSLSNKIVNQFFKDANWLYDHIEIRLGVHNHLLNNARALYAAAYAFEGYEGSELWLKKAREIWDTLWPKLVLNDGFFAEKSTFYHVLLNRTLLEYLADAKLSGRTLSEKFIKKAKKMCTITNLLIRPDGSIPNFGDASPDMPIEWLSGLPVICEEMGLLDEEVRDSRRGYAGGASGICNTTNIKQTRKTHLNNTKLWQTEFFPDSGFLFVRNDKMNLELSAYGHPGNQIHGHADSGRGSFEIWWQGRQIVVDGGIPSYGLTPETTHFKGAQGQNCISIDGIAPSLLKYEADQFPSWYTDMNGPGEWEVSDSNATFTWYGFFRYKSGLLWRRSWSWVDQTITITDMILCVNGKINLNAYLHFGEKLWERQDEHTIKSTDCKLIIQPSQPIKTDLAEMAFSPNYGVINDSLGVIVSGKVKLPFECKWKFEFN